MVIRRVIAPSIDFGALRRELELPAQFPPAAQQEAEQIAAHPPALPALDHTDIPFVTVDPPTSMDLDQAMCLRRRDGGGYRVYYAIADVAAFVPPGGALEAETWNRGQTVYLPDGKIPLHPKELSEGVTSLLPDVVRPAVVWTIDLDAHGATVDVRVERATIRSRAKLNYPDLQVAVDKNSAAEPIALLPEIGQLLIDRGLARGAINLPIPAQEVERNADGDWELVFAPPQPVENFNAQISLLTGMAAAQLMITGKIGLLRTMPPAPPGAFVQLQAVAASLGVDWPKGASPGSVIGAVDGADPKGAAFLQQAGELMRGAGYAAFDGSLPELVEQAAVAAPYAHVTAPLRRLADRYATEACLALFAGTPVPDWAREALPKLPSVMSSTDQKANAATRGAIDLTEAVLLEGRVGEQFQATVLDLDDGHHHGVPATRAVVTIDDPAVRAKCEGTDFHIGTRVPVTLTLADPTTRRVMFQKS